MRAMTRVLALALLAAVATSCGGNDEDRRIFAARRDLCNGLVARGVTVGQADADFRATGLNVSRGNGSINCQSFVPPPGSQCPAGTLCKVFWQSVALDRSDCSANGCVYACTGYTTGQSASNVTDSSLVCAAEFVSGQPFLF